VRRPIVGLTCVTASNPRDGSVRHGVNRDYVRAVCEAGATPILLSPAIGLDGIDGLLEHVDGIVFTGGGDVAPSFFHQRRHPRLGRVERERDRFEIALARGARGASLPILGICRGVQLLNVAAGGTLVQDIPSLVDAAIEHDAADGEPDAVHDVILEPGSLLRRIASKGRVPVNSFHHQAVRDAAPSFRITAVAPDGVIEALEARDGPFCCGVQWHPERPTRGADSRLSRALLEAFVESMSRSSIRGARSSKREATPSSPR
jgi:gamma-glutamyl-gamma-aminobutyrate hydrolase PuuD